MEQEETHPWKLFAPEHSNTLIIGTFPSAKKNWSYDFFYPNKANLFWKVMSKIVSDKYELKHFEGTEAVAERKEILRLLNVAVTDMGLKISRLDGSSLDEKLVLLQYMDIFEILEQHPTINKLILASSSGPVSALKWFNEYLKSKSILHKFPKGSKPLRTQLAFKDKIIELVILYSPSRRAANRISFEALVEMYKNEIII
jgi:G:T/U-mismatch repair DNA glycosylase